MNTCVYTNKIWKKLMDEKQIKLMKNKWNHNRKKNLDNNSS